MTRGLMVRALAEAIATGKTDGCPLRVGIDGRCAAGKTMLAEEIVAELRARGIRVIHRGAVDGFHNPREVRYRQGEYSAIGYYEDAYDYAAVVAHLESAADGVLVFEGLFLFRPELDSYWDYRILVDVDAAISIKRAIARDTGVIGTAEVVRRKYEVRYEPAWLMYVEREQPQARADAIVDNRDVTRPGLRLAKGSTER